MDTSASALSMNRESNKTSYKAWVVCMVASLFFFYEFIQMNMFNAISSDLMQAFHLDATGLSRMSAFYFVANVVFLFPAGALLDRYSSRKVILISLAICVIGTALFSMAHTVGWATFFRFLTGIGSAFCFLSVIRLATRWFAATHLALVIGLVVTVAMLGGVVAQKPLSLLVSAVDWRHALLVDAALGVVIFVLIFQFVRDYPPEFASEHKRELKHISELGYWKSLRLAFVKFQNWLGGIFTCLMNLPIIILGGLWGTQYLVKVQGVNVSDAPYIIQMLFFGMIIGCPAIGWISDNIELRKRPMIIGAIFALIFMLVIINVTHLSFWPLVILFLLLGIASSAQILGYPIVAENSLPAITAMSVSVVNISAQGGLALFEPFFGFLMDLHRKALHVVSPIYVGSDFKWAMWVFPIGIVLALITVFSLKETYAKPLRTRI